MLALVAFAKCVVRWLCSRDMYTCTTQAMRVSRLEICYGGMRFIVLAWLIAGHRCDVRTRKEDVQPPT